MVDDFTDIFFRWRLQPKLNNTYARIWAMDPLYSGSLGRSRAAFNHLDVSTQANIQHVAATYETEDEMMGRILNRERRDTAHYNRQDIREQYCITDRGLGALENKQSLFGCLSSHQGSLCSSRPTSLFTACVRQKVPSDENLCDLYRRHPSEYAPYPRRSRYPWGPIMSDIYHYDEDLYFRRKVPVDPSRYTWMPSDDESIKMEKPRSVVENNLHHEHVINRSPATLPGKKHVSFARSHTLASFDDAISSLSSSTSQLSKITKSQERLLDVRKIEIQPITKQPEHEIFTDKMKRTPMKTQATQTEIGLSRKPLPLAHINLSPRTMQKGAQTNGFIVNGRKLTKSYSEACNKFGNGEFQQFETILDHEPLQRTQSDEPPRSPFVLNPSPPPIFQEEIPPPLNSETSSLSNQSEESAGSKKEIFIDFKPQLPPTAEKVAKRSLMKALSEGEILLDQRRTKIIDDCVVPEKPLHSISHDNINTEEEQKTFTPYFQDSPIQNEGICKPLEENVYSSIDTGMYGQDSIDEDFHEHLIYNKMLLNKQNSQEGVGIDMERWLRDECIVPSISFLPEKRLSPFTSNDSLTNDARDQSDGIWNESQVTVLQVDSGTDNGTALSSSEMTSATSPGSVTLALTPSSRRKHLLMLQHQQRSSFDTENLDEECGDQSSTYPRIVLEVPTVKQADGHGVHFSRQYLSVQSSVPMRKKESPAESPQTAVVPDLLLARTDSCKTNTDVSESTTTDDYITANSGTDSSRKSGSIQGMEMYTNLQAQLNDGSSFESTRGVDLLGDDMVVPSFSPSVPDSRSLCNTPVPEIRTGRSTPSDDSSSSCGSYSVGGSTPDILDRSSAVPSRSSTTPTRKGCPVSDDERSVRYSSSGYYESPMEDDSTWTSSRRENNRKCKDFTLDLSNNPKSYLEINSNTGYKTNKRNIKISPSSDKPKRSKSRMRSPMQNKKSFQLKKTQHVSEKESKATSDESSCDIGGKHISNQNSPRKGKKNKESKRKSLPLNQKTLKNNAEKKPASLPGSLTRRKSSKLPHTTSTCPNNHQNSKISSAESPPDVGTHGPKKTEDSAKLKALSAESLRSVSPGSDSVFYSDPSSHAAIDHQVHCLHCGKEVEIVTTDDPEKSVSGHEVHREEIVQPPAGFEDSPRMKPQGRLFKKLDRRIRSEDRNLVESKKTRYKAEVRAKSEERGAKTYRNKLRPMAKSTNNSQEELKSTDSSPSILPGDPENEDDTGLYDVPYIDGCWIHIDERDEVNSCRNSCSSPNELPVSHDDSISSTESEKDFRKRYQAVTHRMVHRKSCLEMYRRQNNKSFGEYPFF
ncbi:hypothetical protein JTB14_006092 [Gonioctena quinquepunctata]|nr:hypothetical protein JTB14_006092 [Gonioctena quinquepunctata]